MLIKVTQEDIDKGSRLSWCFCPIALAVKRQTKCNLVFVLNVINVKKSNKDLIFIMSRAAHRFITNFDTNKPVKPFNFYAREWL